MVEAGNRGQGVVDPQDEPIAYRQRIRDYYAALGYGPAYRWAHYLEVPFQKLQLSEEPIDGATELEGPGVLLVFQLELDIRANPFREHSVGPKRRVNDGAGDTLRRGEGRTGNGCRVEPVIPARLACHRSSR